MENMYDDELMPENFERMAQAYAETLKNKDFVFVNLKDEEFDFLIGEISVLIAKMKACLLKLRHKIDSTNLLKTLEKYEQKIYENYNKKPHSFVCAENENLAFLSLISAENMLIFKLFLCAIKTDKNEFFYEFILNISKIFAESFSFDFLAH